MHPPSLLASSAQLEAKRHFIFSLSAFFSFFFCFAVFYLARQIASQLSSLFFLLPVYISFKSKGLEAACICVKMYLYVAAVSQF
jgi:hypothetical protein